jgi:leukotriene A-4 hydrolase/aminopeptidase
MQLIHNVIYRPGLLLAAILLLLFGCKPKPPGSGADIAADPHSYARPAEVVVKHLTLDIEVDFSDETISGLATLSLDRAPGANQLYLDTRDLSIEKVFVSGVEGNQEETGWRIGESDSILGAPLIIDLKKNTRQVHILYSSSPDAEALQWLKPNQTAGKEHPFLLTQSQAILARSWIPIQDSPGIRFTYEATVKVPKGLLAVMSAENPREKSADGGYAFRMDQPVPAYLLALAVGDLVFEPLGPRTGVYAEPSVIEKARYEFGEMEEMLTLAEGLYGPYRWGRYDVIVLPPSFPFGGMENPRLTFATPTILAGDRSLVSLIAHELAHSWSGNLVTNATWNDFWLNEGFTVYFEHRIMEALKGREYSEMLASLSFSDLLEEVKDLGAGSPDTHLYLELKGRNPDDAVGGIPYDKGYYFLRLIEESAGRAEFDAFLKAYFDENAFKTMTTERFVERLRTHLLDKQEGLAEKINVDAWVYGPGIPENCPTAVSERFQKVEDAKTLWAAGTAPSELDTEGWSSHEWHQFLHELMKHDTLSLQQLSDLDAAFGFTQSTNSELQCAWYELALKHHYAAANPAIESFLIAVGRRKFLTPLYREMMRSEEGKKMAWYIYAKARPNYHPIATRTIDGIVGWIES